MSLMSYEKSLELLHSHMPKYEKVEKIALTECLGRILAEDIKAPHNHPQLPTASLDGYAFKFQNNLNSLKVLGSVKAGFMSEFKVDAKTCVKTFTGSLMSEGSDTLIPVENVLIKKDEIIIQKPVDKGFGVRNVAESYTKGELLLEKGTKLDYSELALLAELGFFHISVFIKPVIGILSSGDELKDLGESLENPAQIRSSNHIALASLAQKLGCESRIFPLCKDEKSAVSKALANALKTCDILLTTGGVSMGDFDFLKSALKQYEILIDKVAIKPGRHIKIAKSDEKFIIALPGFPYSAMVMFNLYVREIINSYLLSAKTHIFKAFFRGSFEKKSSLLEFIPCKLSFENAKIFAELKPNFQSSSAVLNKLNHQGALVCVQKDKLENEDLVDVFLMP